MHLTLAGKIIRTLAFASPHSTIAQRVPESHDSMHEIKSAGVVRGKRIECLRDWEREVKYAHCINATHPQAPRFTLLTLLSTDLFPPALPVPLSRS